MELLTLALYIALAAFTAAVFYRGYPLNVVVLSAIARTIIEYIARGSTPVLPHWTLTFEILQRVTRSVADTFGDRVLEPQHYLKLRWLSELSGDFNGGFACREHGTEITRVTVGGLEHLWLKAKPGSTAPTSKRAAKRQTTSSSTAAAAPPIASTGARPPPLPLSPVASVGRRFVVLYFHGGGFTLNCPSMYIEYCNRLRTALLRDLVQTHDVAHAHVDVLIASYRLGPEHPFPSAPLDCVATYKYLLATEKLSPRQIILAGDSAGGNLVLSTMLRLRQAQPSLLPLAGLLHCPKTSMAKAPAPSDGSVPSPHCFLSPAVLTSFRNSYLATPDDPATWCDASPLHCDLQNLPPIFLQGAMADSLYHESVAIADKIKADGITNWEVEMHAHMPHIFAFFPSRFVLPYAAVGVASTASFAARQFASTLSSRAKVLKQRRVASQVVGA